MFFGIGMPRCNLQNGVISETYEKYNRVSTKGNKLAIFNLKCIDRSNIIVIRFVTPSFSPCDIVQFLYFLKDIMQHYDMI